MHGENIRKFVQERYGQGILDLTASKGQEIRRGITDHLNSIGLTDNFLKENLGQIIKLSFERRIDELLFGDTFPLSIDWGVYYPEVSCGLKDKLKVFDLSISQKNLKKNSFFVGDNVSYDVAMALKMGKLFERTSQGPEAVATISEVYADNLDSCLYGRIPMQRLYEVFEKDKRLGLEEMIFLASHSLSPNKSFEGGLR